MARQNFQGRENDGKDKGGVWGVLERRYETQSEHEVNEPWGST